MPPRPNPPGPPPTPPEAAARRLGGERLPRCLALRGVEALVAVLVEFRDELALPAEAAGPERGRALESTGTEVAGPAPEAVPVPRARIGV